jgi:hypothetical protein
MNEHTSVVIFCRVSPKDDNNIITISNNHEYKVWNFTTGYVGISLTLELPKHSLIVVADMTAEGDEAYFALDTKFIVVYSFRNKNISASCLSYRGEDVIEVAGRSTDAADYLIVTTRTSCVLYLLCSTGIVSLTGYYINARKSNTYELSMRKYSYNTRYYFTTCMV